MTSAFNPAPRLTKADPELYTASEVATLLRCSQRQVWRLRDGGRMPQALRVGRLVRWRKSVIADWIGAGCPRSH